MALTTVERKQEFCVNSLKSGTWKAIREEPLTVARNVIMLIYQFAEPMIIRSLVPAPGGAFIALPGVFYRSLAPNKSMIDININFVFIVFIHRIGLQDYTPLNSDARIE